MKISILLLGLAVTAMLAGCEDDEKRMSPVVTDSAGVPIVDNPQSGWTPFGAWSVARVPALELGSSTSDSNFQFYRVSGALRLPDGRLMVANAGSHQVRFYDATGRFLNAVGRNGGGPGEFEHITWAQKYRGDSVVIFDRRLVRLSVFDGEGRLARTITPRGEHGDVMTNVLGAFADGSFLVAREAVPEQPLTGIFRPVLSLFHADTEGHVRDSLVSYPGEESYLHVFQAGGAMDSPRLFAVSTEFAVSGDRFYVGQTGEYALHKRSAVGRLLSVFRRGAEPSRVMPSDVEQIKNQQLDAVRHLAHIRDRVSEFLDAMPLPSTMPAFGPLLVDEIGNLWVQEYLRPGMETRSWTVFDSDGGVVAMLQTPDRFQPQHIGEDFLLGRWLDENGEEHVRMYGLIKG